MSILYVFFLILILHCLSIDVAFSDKDCKVPFNYRLTCSFLTKDTKVSKGPVFKLSYISTSGLLFDNGWFE